MEEYATHQQPFIIEMEVGGGRILKDNKRIYTLKQNTKEEKEYSNLNYNKIIIKISQYQT